MWERFGEIQNYVEPFFGSGAILLASPIDGIVETVNDMDAYIANFWRAMKAEPERLAEIADNPVNEVDLEAWHKWLVTASRKAELAARCKDDPEYYDALIAGRWVWGLCQWLGCGWCCGEWHGEGSNDNAGRGINVRDPDRGGKLPHLGPGRGVHRKLPHLGNAGQGVHPCSMWFEALANRLRRVRVCCGDWSRVCTNTPTAHLGLTGIFLDPPYSAEAGRDMGTYKEESGTVAHDVRVWAIENGENQLMRIALCGYEGEHEMPSSWECVSWKAHGGYGNRKKAGRGSDNARRERIWFSPHCVSPYVQPGLFDA